MRVHILDKSVNIELRDIFTFYTRILFFFFFPGTSGETLLVFCSEACNAVISGWFLL